MSEIEKFLEYCSITGGKNTIKKLRYSSKKYEEYFKGKLNNLTLKDFRNFLAWLNKQEYSKATKNEVMKAFKRFLKWKYKDYSERFDDFNDMKLYRNPERQLSKEDLLTQDEMQIIVKAAENMKYKTLLLLFMETACRPEEVLKLKWKEVDLEKKEVKLNSAKTGRTRFIPVKNTASHLKRYKEECFPIPPKADDKIFDMSINAVHRYLGRMEKKLEFGKHLYPYLWRHSVLSRMIKKLSPKVYEMYAGHSLEMGMKVYAHLDNDDLRNELNEKIYKIQPLTKEEREEMEELKKNSRVAANAIHDIMDFLNMQIEVQKNPTKEGFELLNKKAKELTNFS